MAGITLAQAEAQLALWLAADAAVALNQSYRINERQFTKADALEVRKNVQFWEARVQRLSGGGGARVRNMVMG